MEQDHRISIIRPQYPGELPQLLSCREGDKIYTARILAAAEESYGFSASWRRAPYLRGHTHPLFHLLLYTSGRNRLLLDDQRHYVKEAILVLTSPGQKHEFRPQADDAYSYTHVTFQFLSEDVPYTGSWQRLLSGLFRLPLRDIRFPLGLDTGTYHRFGALLKSLVSELRSRTAYGIPKAHSLLGELLLEIAAALHPPEEAHRFTLIDRVRREIEAHYTRDWGIPELAAMAAMSEGHFLRLFKERTGTTPISYRRDLRIIEACHLLIRTNLSWSEIADTVGFDDPCYFSKVFRRQQGISPGRYRRLMVNRGTDV